ncbi:hypothetical protein JHK85_006545 [Glycine max]|nr:hypothetical protein JHK85_006545 [Glycine max]
MDNPAECFKDRIDVQCLHRWQKFLNPKLVKGPWSKESLLLVFMIDAHNDDNSWTHYGDA